MRAGLFAFSVVLLAAVLAGAGQQAARKNTQPASPPPVAVKKSAKTAGTSPASARSAKSNLSSFSLESPEATANSIRSRAGASKSGHAASSGEGPTVTEFHSVNPGIGGRGGSSALASSGKKDSVLKSIHGEVNGALMPGASAAQAGSAAAGAKSKTGKTYIYVETDHAKVSSPR